MRSKRKSRRRVYKSRRRVSKNRRIRRSRSRRVSKSRRRRRVSKSKSRRRRISKRRRRRVSKGKYNNMIQTGGPKTREGEEHLAPRDQLRHRRLSRYEPAPNVDLVKMSGPETLRLGNQRMALAAVQRAARAEALVLEVAPLLAETYAAAARDYTPYDSTTARVGIDEPSTLCQWVDKILGDGGGGADVFQNKGVGDFLGGIPLSSPMNIGKLILAGDVEGHEESIIRKAGCAISADENWTGENPVRERLVADSLNSQIYRSWKKEMEIETIIDNLGGAGAPVTIVVFKADNLSIIRPAGIEDGRLVIVPLPARFGELTGKSITVPVPKGVAQGDVFVVSPIPLAVLQVTKKNVLRQNMRVPMFMYTCEEEEEEGGFEWTITSTIDNVSGLARHSYTRPDGVESTDGWSLTPETVASWDALQAASSMSTAAGT
jgi:hypothetical protein